MPLGAPCPASSQCLPTSKPCMPLPPHHDETNCRLQTSTCSALGACSCLLFPQGRLLPCDWSAHPHVFPHPYPPDPKIAHSLPLSLANEACPNLMPSRSPYPLAGTSRTMGCMGPSRNPGLSSRASPHCTSQCPVLLSSTLCCLAVPCAA